jgi:CTP synthase (UTP-ammonia lyase)
MSSRETGTAGTPSAFDSGSAPVHVAIVGDRDPAIVAHQGVERSLALGDTSPEQHLVPEWLSTDTIAALDDARLERADGVWCVPVSPYRSEAGALAAIRHARERGVPFLGTCGGFQHAVLEYARHVLGQADACHAETAPEGALQVIAPLACALVEQSEEVDVVVDSRLHRIVGAGTTTEGYHCSFGVHPELESRLFGHPLVVCARGAGKEVRAIELREHPFFVGTLFQPERKALTGVVHPLVAAFFAAARAHAAARRLGV